MTYPSDRDFARVIISDVDSDWTLALDFKTGMERRVPTSAPGGLMPLIGDVWLLTKGNGIWELERCIDRNVDSHERSMGDVLQALERAGIIRWRPDEADDDDVLSRHGTAYIGEMRHFPTSIIPAGWWPANGATNMVVSRLRRLFRKLGTTFGGDGISTFGVPNLSTYAVSSASQALYYPANWTAYSGWAPYASRVGNIVTIQGLVQNNSGVGIAVGGAQIATIPTGFQPTVNTMSSVHTSMNIHTRVDAYPDTRIIVSGPAQTIPNGGWVQLDFTYRCTAAEPQPGHWLICAD